MSNTAFYASCSPATTRSTARKLNIHRHKRRKLSEDHHQALLPGLPDDIAQLCLSLVPPSILYSVCRSWRRLIYAPSFPPFLSLYAVVLPGDRISNSVDFCCFDPISSKWNLLPPPPSDPPHRFLFRHRSFISRTLPIQSVAVSGKLTVVAASRDGFLPALSRPLVFDPISGEWSHGPPLAAPRRWCAAGAIGGAVYVASGMGAHYNSVVARTVEKWDLLDSERRSAHEHRRQRRGWGWRRIAGLRDGKFSRDAIEAVGWRGKLCMVNVKGTAAKEGITYDVGGDRWEQMPEGMLAGWRGPAAAMEEETLYAVDESKGLLREYDQSRDAWAEVARSDVLRGALQVAAAGGKVCVLCADGASIAVVDVKAAAKIWVVDAPPGIEVVGIHILPRLAG